MYGVVTGWQLSKDSLVSGSTALVPRVQLTVLGHFYEEVVLVHMQGYLFSAGRQPYFWNKSIDSLGFIMSAVINPRGRLPPLENSMESAHEHPSENFNQFSVWARFNVRFFAQVCENTTDYPCSAITSVRVKLTIDNKNSDPNNSDPDYTWVVFGLFTTLEYYLGIITACLPLLPPVGSRIAASFHDSIFSNALSWTRLSTWRLLSRWNGSKSLNLSETATFQPVHHNGYTHPTLDQPEPEDKTTASHVKPYSLQVPQHGRDCDNKPQITWYSSL